MCTKWYKIKGISKELYEEWKDDIREDIVVREENGEYQFRIRLTRFEAFCMRRQIKKTNLNNPVCLRLEKEIAGFFSKKEESK